MRKGAAGSAVMILSSAQVLPAPLRMSLIRKRSRIPVRGRFHIPLLMAK